MNSCRRIDLVLSSSAHVSASFFWVQPSFALSYLAFLCSTISSWRSASNIKLCHTIIFSPCLQKNKVTRCVQIHLWWYCHWTWNCLNLRYYDLIGIFPDIFLHFKGCCILAPQVNVCASFRHQTCSKPPCSWGATCSLRLLEYVEISYLHWPGKVLSDHGRRLQKGNGAFKKVFSACGEHCSEALWLDLIGQTWYDTQLNTRGHVSCFISYEVLWFRFLLCWSEMHGCTFVTISYILGTYPQWFGYALAALDGFATDDWLILGICIALPSTLYRVSKNFWGHISRGWTGGTPGWLYLASRFAFWKSNENPMV